MRYITSDYSRRSIAVDTMFNTDRQFATSRTLTTDEYKAASWMIIKRLVPYVDAHLLTSATDALLIELLKTDFDARRAAKKLKPFLKGRTAKRKREEDRKKRFDATIRRFDSLAEKVKKNITEEYQRLGFTGGEIDKMMRTKRDYPSTEYSHPTSCICRVCGYLLQGSLGAKLEKHCTEYPCPNCGAEMYRRNAPESGEELVGADHDPTAILKTMYQFKPGLAGQRSRK